MDLTLSPFVRFVSGKIISSIVVPFGLFIVLASPKTYKFQRNTSTWYLHSRTKISGTNVNWHLLFNFFFLHTNTCWCTFLHKGLIFSEKIPIPSLRLKRDLQHHFEYLCSGYSLKLFGCPMDQVVLLWSYIVRNDHRVPRPR
jgi:hypothetical protein